MLTTDHRSELERRGAANVRFKLTSYGGGHQSTLDGFLRSGNPLRGDVEDWLADQERVEKAQQAAILKWARIAGVAAIAGIVVAAAGLGLTVFH
jgi:hypothetical protein